MKKSSVHEVLGALLSLLVFFILFADGLVGDNEASQVLKPGATRQPLEAMWTYCSWCGRRCSLREAATCGMAVHYPCLELHISNCKDCKRTINHDKGVRPAKEKASLTLTSSFLRVLTRTFFWYLRFQRLLEKLLLAPSSAEIVHSTGGPALEEEKAKVCYRAVQV